MAATSFTPISLYYSTTASAVPTAGNLVAGELAINTADGKLFYKDSSEVVQTLATKAAASGSFTTLTSTADASFATSSGNVGIGTSSPNNKLDVVGSATTNSDARSVITATDTTAFAAGVGGGISFKAKYNTAGAYFDTSNIKGIKENGTDGNFAGAMVFSTAPNGSSPTERMRIDSSGNLLVGTTSQFGFGKECIYFVPATNTGVAFKQSTDTGSPTPLYFLNAAGTAIGSVTTSSVATLYNTTSDYRLKNDVTPITNALATIEALNPVSFIWSDGKTDDGFIAHEIQAVIPNCVTGEKDAVDKDGKPIYQQMDNSGVIPFLVKAIQELNAKVTALEAQLATK